jgi:hypothetical protein
MSLPGFRDGALALGVRELCWCHRDLGGCGDAKSLRRKILKPLGNPSINGRKSFSAAESLKVDLSVTGGINRMLWTCKLDMLVFHVRSLPSAHAQPLECEAILGAESNALRFDLEAVPLEQA